MMSRLLLVLLACSALASSLDASVASASTLSYVGTFDPDDPNDLFITSFTLDTASNVTLQTYGYGGTAHAPGGANAAGVVVTAGGFDPYLSLFAGQGDAATFVVANDDGACPPGTPSPTCSDATLTLTNLAAGTYTLVLSAFSNFSFAEHMGAGTLGDGFVGFGSYYDIASGTFRTSAYALDVTLGEATGPEPPPVPVPEPGTLALVATGVAWVAARSRRGPARSFFTD